MEANLIKSCWQKYQELAKKAEQIIINKEDGYERFYNLETHRFLSSGDDNCDGAILPLPKEEWPDFFNDLRDEYDPSLNWPGYSTFVYSGDVCYSRVSKILFYSGYCILENELTKCSFFIALKMMDDIINGVELKIPKVFAIDPFADLKNINPEFYIGAYVKIKFIEDWFLNHGKNGNLLENSVKAYNELKKKEEEGICSRNKYISQLEAYQHQIFYAPHCFPEEMINFAEKNSLHIPKQDKDVWSRDRR